MGVKSTRKMSSIFHIFPGEPERPPSLGDAAGGLGDLGDHNGYRMGGFYHGYHGYHGDFTMKHLKRGLDSWTMNGNIIGNSGYDLRQEALSGTMIK